VYVGVAERGCGIMTKFICEICKESFDDSDAAFDHLVEVHAHILDEEYIIEAME
jgi:hypothetical protein